MTVIENLLVLKSYFNKDDNSGDKQIIKEYNKRYLEQAYAILDELEVPHMAHNLASELSGGQSKLVDIGRARMQTFYYYLTNQ